MNFPPMKCYALLIVSILFIVNGLSAQSIEKPAFSTIFTKYDDVYLCRFVSQKDDSVIVADKQSGQQFALWTTLEKGEGPGSNFIVYEFLPDRYAKYRAYDNQTKDEDLRQVITRLREVNKIKDSTQQFKAIKDWIFRFMEVPGFITEATNEWGRNKLLMTYLDDHHLTDKQVLTDVEQERLYKFVTNYHWLNYHSMDALYWLGDQYRDGLKVYLYQMLRQELTNLQIDANDSRFSSVCDYCAMRLLINQKIVDGDMKEMMKQYLAKKEVRDEEEIPDLLKKILVVPF